MYIDPEKCKTCLDCVPVCPMGAIGVVAKNVEIDPEACVECGVCLRFGICPEGAIAQVDMIPWPRVVRAIFSDPVQRHESTGIQGRGTEEMKTNDVTGLFAEGMTGFSIELGRPSLGAYLRDLDKVLRKVVPMGVALAEDNPVVQLIADRRTGAVNPDVLGEKVLSAIVEFLVPEEKAVDFIRELGPFLDREIDTVATMSVISRAGADGRSRLMARLETLGIDFYPNGKVNLGMAAGKKVQGNQEAS